MILVMKLLIVGSGVTGCVITHNLSKSGCMTKTAVSMWEKSRGVGGRMSTHRFEGDAIADMGAQYITVPWKSNKPATTSPAFNEAIQRLLYSNVLVPFNGVIEGEISSHQEGNGNKNFVATCGINSVAKYFVNDSRAEKCFNKKLQAVDTSGDVIHCLTETGVSEMFNGLVLTMPLPQVKMLLGNISLLLKQHEQLLNAVEYSSRYAVAFTYKADVPLCFNWSAKYFQDDIIRYVSCEPKKRGQTNVNTPVLIAHTSVPFGVHHLEEDKKEVIKIVESRLAVLIPELPPPVDNYCVRWRYSQVCQPVCCSEGYLVLQDDPLIVLTGDAFTHSNLEGSFKAASATAGLIIERLGKA